LATSAIQMECCSSPTPVAIANGINDFGQVVGTSGSCGNTVGGGFEAGPHAVLWEPDGSVHDLGNFGGTVNTGMLAVGTTAWAINNRGMVAGQAALKGNKTFHPFLWTRQTGMMDLGVLPGDLVGAGLNMNNRGEIVGASVSAPGPATGDPRAFLWKQGSMMDLNDLVPADAPHYLLTAFGINDEGAVVGFGVTDAGDIHGFLATPTNGSGFGDGDAVVSKGRVRPAALSDESRKFIRRHLWGPGR
jgi:probable HAF family extracellular repeat protein